MAPLMDWHAFVASLPSLDAPLMDCTGLVTRNVRI